ncbi:ATP-dependent DNA helicase DinG [Paenisporosarcina cavernae]|uniref:3'-5' exonuclease DinG n=1 Tax=Paenisporosarcina cavernae TaxID=2320858 RepID=A0A385YV21_9BACL|nr:ATP-dependent DNA helicase DinG [Paenisporosarcina cavernae]AYC29412.1 ATP-dependent helicase DinG [Paenisporosarcina cavernae]
MEKPIYAVVDIETTGNAPSRGDRMIQFAVVFVQDGAIIDEYSTFINPERAIPKFIEDLTSISSINVEGAPTFKGIAPKISKLLKGTTFVAHNVSFDLPFIQAELKRAGEPKWVGETIDTVELSRVLYPTLFSFKLQDVTAENGIVLTNAHRADDDAMATAKLFVKCLEDLKNLPLLTLQLLHKRAFQWKSRISTLLHEFIVEKRTSLLAHDGLVYKELALKKWTLTQRLAATQDTFPKSWEEKKRLFENTSTFRLIQEQCQMMDVVWDSLVEKSEVIIEGSTGIGKSLAYLLPSYFYAKQSGLQAVISTSTTPLMNQIVDKEITQLSKLLNKPVNAAIVKGIHHYIDLEKFSQSLSFEDESYDEMFTKCQVAVWLTMTETGDLEEINCSSGGMLFLDRVRKKSRNKQEMIEFDFYERALQRSINAEIVVTNHSMIAHDVLRDHPLFHPEKMFLILDEAHQFGHSVQQLGEQLFAYTHWKYLFGQIGDLSERQLMGKFRQVCTIHGLEVFSQFHQLEKYFNDFQSSFDQLITEMIDTLRDNFKQKYQHRYQFPIRELAIPLEEIHGLYEKGVRFKDLGQRILHTLFTLQNDYSGLDQQVIFEWEFLINEWNSRLNEWDHIFFSSKESAAWVDIDTRSLPGSLQITQVPILLQSSIHRIISSWRNSNGVIWTSGTFTTPKNSRYLAEQYGIPTSVPIHQFIAPTNFYNGAKVFVVTDMPDIQQVSQAEYIESVAEVVIETAMVTEGKCFVLFTSHDMLRKTVEFIQDTEQLKEFTLFAQGITSGSRSKLLKSFNRIPKSILFGTTSFWEGIDMAADSLAAVVLVRLPFASPEEPIFKAKATILESQGMNPFSEISLPEALLKFRQGFGRLIRRPNDRGAFIILDRRIETKSYGKEFIHALPSISTEKVSLEDMVLALEHWYTKKA